MRLFSVVRFAFIILMIQRSNGKSTRIRLAFEELMDCDGFMNSYKLSDFLDMSNLNAFYDDSLWYINGTLTVIEDVEPDDEIRARGEIFAFKRNAWHPTIYSAAYNDMCAELTKEGSFIYKLLHKVNFVNEEDRFKCPVAGSTYILETTSASFDTERVELSGLSKLRIFFEVFNKNNELKRGPFCYEVLSEIIKL